MPWRIGLLRLWAGLSVFWCLVAIGWVCWTLVDRSGDARWMAWQEAKILCAKEPDDKRSQCVAELTAALELEYDASVAARLERILGNPVDIIGILGVMLLPPLSVLLVGRIVTWIVRGIRGALST
jgi:hypothetical protein